MVCVISTEIFYFTTSHISRRLKIVVVRPEIPLHILEVPVSEILRDVHFIMHKKLIYNYIMQKKI